MKRLKKKVLYFIISVLSIVLIFVIVCVTFLNKISPIIEDISEEEITAITASAVREAVMKVMSENANEQPEIILYDDNGNINAVQLNHEYLNNIMQSAGVESQKKLEQLGIRGLDVPIGSLSGFVLFSGKGPMLNLKIIPVGSVAVHVKSSFSSKGINQTNHKVILSVTSDVNIVLPGLHNAISTYTEILICDTIIIGKVPSVYWTDTELDYDFVPKVV